MQQSSILQQEHKLVHTFMVIIRYLIKTGIEIKSRKDQLIANGSTPGPQLLTGVKSAVENCEPD